MSDAPRPLVIGHGWFPDQPGGLNRYVYDLVHATSHAGLASDVVVLGDATGAGPVVRSAGDHDAPLPARFARIVRVAGEAAGRAEVVDVHFAVYGLAALASRAVRRLPLVVHFHGPWADEGTVQGERGVRTAAKRRIERTVYRRARHAIVLSTAFRRLLVERYGVPPWRVSIVPPGIDLDRFQPGDRSRARDRFGVEDGEWVAACVRRLVPRMGIDVLLDAWARLDDGLLLLAGDGPERAPLEARARALGLGDDRVRFLGRIDDDALADLYRAADVSVVPTVALEGYGLVVLESLASGTPAIVTDVGGLPEPVDGLDRSLVVPAGDPGALAARLRTARDGDVPNREACRAHAQMFDWRAVVDRTSEIHRRAAERPAERRPRVVFLDHTAVLSGGELAMARLLPALDVDAHVILGNDGPLARRLASTGTSYEIRPMPAVGRELGRDRVRISRLPFAGVAASAWYAARLAVRLRRLRPDVVHTNSLKSALYGGVAARLAGIPVVWHVRDRIERDYLPAPAVRLVRAAARRVPTAVIANSHATLATVGLDRSPRRDGRIPTSVVPSPVDVQRASRPSGSAAFTVGVVGRLAPWKGQHVFLDAFAKAFPDGCERAVLVGDALFGEGDYADRLRRQITALELDGRVELTGFRDDVTAEYARLDVLAHTSTIPEPFGQVVVEGMAAGLAVVAPDAGGPAEVITDGVDGVLYRMGDADDLARRLRELAHDEPRRARLGGAARATSASYTPEHVAQRVLDVYRHVLGATRLPGP